MMELFSEALVTLFPVFEDNLELRYRLDSSREAEVLRSRARNLADGRLHSVSIRRLAASVSLQVCGDPGTFHSQSTLNATFKIVKHKAMLVK